MWPVGQPPPLTKFGELIILFRVVKIYADLAFPGLLAITQSEIGVWVFV
jgi:hypothetical protein